MRVLSYLVVAVVSLALGVAGTFFLLRSRVSPPPHEMGPSVHEGVSAPPTDSADHEGEHPQEAAGKVVYVSPARQQLIGVRTAAIERRPLESSIRTVGTLAYDETRVTQIHTKIAGWVERVHVDYVGKLVRRDDPLLDVYSPELVSTQTEYLLALKARSELGASPVEATRSAAEALFAAARDRLRLWDIPEVEIATLERTREVRKTLTLHAPFDGIVLERNVFGGQYIAPEMPTFKIADLSRIWAFGAVFEYELPLVRLGQPVEIEFSYGAASRKLQGAITYVYPEIDPQTRRVKIRAEFENPGLELKPDTYVTFVIRVRGGERLVIPKEAVIDTGVTRYAILAHPNGYFEPREIEVGPPDDESYPLLAGLEEGDRVVTSAQFLIDSETNLQAAMQSMIGMPGMDMPASEEGGMEGMDMPMPSEKTPPPPEPPEHRH
ncbi:MAG TPA: efflux RND transporter periplasmic adaptor subunit [Vicinamibacteria bacterium]|jgi:RND family efflux transporter MFP subunit